MLELTLEQYGFEKAKVGFDRLIEGVKDLRPAWDEVQQSFYLAEEKAFTSQGASQGGKWKALSPSYAKWKARRYPGRTILEREGDLRLSLTGKGGAVVVKMPMMYSELSQVPYAKWHATSGPMFRPPVRLTPLQRGKIGDIVAKYVRREIKRAFMVSRVGAV